MRGVVGEPADRHPRTRRNPSWSSRRVDVTSEVIGTEVVEVGAWVGQEVPDDDEDGTADGDDGSFLAAAFRDASISGTQERVGAPAASPKTRAR